MDWSNFYPTDYCFGPSNKDIEWLKRKIKEDEMRV